MKHCYSKPLSVIIFISVWLFTITYAYSQSLLNPATHPKFVEPLPIPGVMQPAAPYGTHYEVSISQFTQYLGLKNTNGDSLFTTVWGYNGSYPGPTVEVTQNVPVTVKWNNNLVDNGIPLMHPLPIDTTVHWAMPMNWPYSGVPVVTHVHGGHFESESDGNPDAWFTPGFTHTGPYWSKQTYYYSNDQQSATIWYHDHAMGITRLNVYMGLAGFYLIRDAWENSLNLPSGNYEIPIAIQDRMFTDDGQLYYPHMSESDDMDNTIPEPTILPEMFGDFILVNGKTWPLLNVEPRKYRLRLLNGSDSRFYNLYFGSNISFVQIGTDGGLLDAPVSLNKLVIGPGERKDVIVDFSNPSLAGQTIILKNNARSPFPKGETVDSPTTGQIMGFAITLPLNGVDNSVIPASLRQSPIQPLGAPSVTRQLLLFEGEDEFGRLKPMLGTSALGPLNYTDPITENPMLDAIEDWEVINFTEDAHPIHLHLVNFQVINRQKFNAQQYIPGNPASLQLLGQPKLPEVGDRGWKDTQIMYPGEVTRIRAKFDLPGLYVWHCHILSHEDHEMMRKFYVGTMPSRFQASNDQNVPFAEVSPNPFAVESVIKMFVNTDGNYKTEIFNSLGQKVKDLADTFYTKGIYELKWDGSDNFNTRADNGIYIIKITGEAGTDNLKIILNR